MQMTCPKCRGEMRQYERSGVVIDQCGECRGIFLDRGELEKLFDAEANWNRQHGGAPQQAAPAGAGYPPPPPPPPAAAPHQPGYGTVPPPPPPPPGHGYAQPAYGHSQQQHYGYHGHYRRKKKHGFLGELFD
ncbi:MULTISPECIES: zf-TFIIB domain-containing protein [unclassified Micromonospora]|uniref:TFIIB-type zinc ribbon-containing protein n=1 Tax=unclassified Micromonospora TaxID=2617518 RepID=UPI001C250DFD|nr:MULTISPECIES: zf-TFIIB domain-containing protein [unclassified Micromonospora]MBU8857926.1 zf-TFIIB domain-containing protein [Micromonospora sp. WMMB482]MDM4783557.1 zf-TFIIB domain-containing protein [Micromonospora sp. b486]